MKKLLNTIINALIAIYLIGIFGLTIFLVNKLIDGGLIKLPMKNEASSPIIEGRWEEVTTTSSIYYRKEVMNKNYDAHYKRWKEFISKGEFFNCGYASFGRFCTFDDNGQVVQYSPPEKSYTSEIYETDMERLNVTSNMLEEQGYELRVNYIKENKFIPKIKIEA